MSGTLDAAILKKIKFQRRSRKTHKIIRLNGLDSKPEHGQVQKEAQAVSEVFKEDIMERRNNT